MTPQLGIGLLSLVGAMLFIAAGFFIARLRSSPAAGPSSGRALGLEIPDSTAEAADLRGQMESLRERMAAELQASQRQLDTSRTNESKLMARIQELERQTARTQELERQTAEQDRASRQLTELEEKLRSTTKRSNELAAQVRATNESAEKLRGQLNASNAARDQALRQRDELSQRLEELEDAEPTKVQAKPQLDESRFVQMEHELARKKTELESLQRALKQAEADLAPSQRSEQELARVRAELESHQQTTRGNEAKDKQLKTATQELESARRANAGLQNRIAGLESELGTLRDRDRALREAQQELEQHRAREASDDNRLARLSEVEEKNYQLTARNKELEELTADLETLGSVTRERDDLKLEIGMLRQREGEADGLREERAQLATRLEEALQEQTALAERIRGLERLGNDRTDLALRIEVLTKQVAEVDALREEQIRLRETAAEAAELRTEVEALRAENAGLRSSGLAQQRQEPPMVEAEEGSSFGDSLQTLVNRIAQDQSSRGAVLADEMGLVVAGTGEHAEALAAISAMFNEIDTRVRGLLPLGELAMFVLRDQNEVTFAAQPIKFSSDQLLLATLTVGPAPTRSALVELLQRIS